MSQFKIETIVAESSQNKAVQESHELRVRRATPDDLDLLFDYYEQARIASTDKPLTASEKEEHRESFGHMLADERYGVQMVEDKDGPLAAILFETNPDPIMVDNFLLHGESPQGMTSCQAMFLAANVEPSISRLHLNSITVNPDRRGHGTGQKVMELFEAQYMGTVDVITFQTGKNNKVMQRLAEKCGFTILEVADDSMEGYDGEYLLAVKDIGKGIDKLALSEFVKQIEAADGKELEEMLKDIEVS